MLANGKTMVSVRFVALLPTLSIIALSKISTVLCSNDSLDRSFINSRAQTITTFSTTSKPAIMKHSRPAYICPSLLSSDLSNLNRDAQIMLDMGADWLHMDIMDGHFVPNLTFGPPVIQCLHKSQPNAHIDCHLMVTDPAMWVEPLAKAGVKSFSFHLESNMPEGGVPAMIKKVRDAGMKVGIVIKPKTPVEELFPYVDDIDLALIMSVEPGFSGQKFMPDMMPKVRALREKYPDLDIQIDGGVGPETINDAAEAGANAVVAASAIFGSDDKQGVINALRAGVEKYQDKQTESH